MTVSDIDRLIQLLARVPGLGPRSARRAALHLLKKRELLMQPLARAECGPHDASPVPAAGEEGRVADAAGGGFWRERHANAAIEGDLGGM